MSDQLKNWTIQVFFDHVGDDGAKRRAKSVYHVASATIGEAYEQAERDLPGYKLGYIVPGFHEVAI